MYQDYINKFYSILLLLIISTSGFAAEQKNFFAEGQDYVKLADTVRNSPAVQKFIEANPNKVQVLFFFNYGCHGCDYFHAPFHGWINKQETDPKSKVVVYEYPVAFNVQWKKLAQLYYVRKMLDPDGMLDEEIFTAIHKQRLKLWDEKVMQKFFVEHGYGIAQFNAAFNSFTVSRQVQKADNIAKAYNITATPDIVVNGPVNSYRIDVAKAGRNANRILDILNYLEAREAKLL